MAKIGTNANCITCWPFGNNSGGITWWSNFELILVSGTTYNWANLEPMQVAFYLAGEITQVIESIPWVRCASGNVSMVANHWSKDAMVRIHRSGLVVTLVAAGIFQQPAVHVAGALLTNK